jgi:hypothetical protein
MILDFCCSRPRTFRYYLNKRTQFTKANKSSASKAQSKQKREKLEALKKNMEEILYATVTRDLETQYYVQKLVFGGFISESKHLSL